MDQVSAETDIRNAVVKGDALGNTPHFAQFIATELLADFEQPRVLLMEEAVARRADPFLRTETVP